MSSCFLQVADETIQPKKTLSPRSWSDGRLWEWDWVLSNLSYQHDHRRLLSLFSVLSLFRFSSIPLALYLDSVGLYYVGTLRNTRRFAPKEILKPVFARRKTADQTADAATAAAEQDAPEEVSGPKIRNLTPGMKQGDYLMRFSKYNHLSVTTWKG